MDPTKFKEKFYCLGYPYLIFVMLISNTSQKVVYSSYNIGGHINIDTTRTSKLYHTHSLNLFIKNTTFWAPFYIFMLLIYNESQSDIAV